MSIENLKGDFPKLREAAFVSCGALIKTSLVDFPGCVAATLFLKGCNLRCPYCYNKALVLGGEDETLQNADEVISLLQKRSGLLQGFVISGGEPLLNPITEELIKAAKSLGYKIKLDTNGTFPQLLEKLIKNEETRPDFIAMDIKTSPSRYSILSQSNAAESFAEKLEKTISLMKENYTAENREWRTVLVPPLVKVSDIEEMGKMLPEDASWQFANFRPENCIDPEYNKISPYLDKQINEIIGCAEKFVKNAALR